MQFFQSGETFLKPYNSPLYNIALRILYENNMNVSIEKIEESALLENIFPIITGNEFLL